MTNSMFSLLIVVIFIGNGGALPEDPSVTYEMLYSAAIESYNSERWYECFAYMQRALDDFKFYHETVIDCRLQCFVSNPSGKIEFSNTELEFFAASLKRSNCLRRCKEAKLPDRPEGISAEVDEEFKDLKPYDYLQICAYKAERHDIAAAAAYTYLLAHPDHEVMKNNVAFYQSIPEVKPSYFKNMEAKHHQHLYSKGVEAYGAENWDEAIAAFEEAIVHYFNSYHRCLSGCEGKYDHKELLDFYNAIAGKERTDHWIHVMSCQHACPNVLSTWSGQVIKNYFLEHYNYLQYAYFKVGNLKAAAECVATYLMVMGKNENMLANREYYLSTGQVKEEDFVPREIAKHHFDDIVRLNNQMKYVQEEYMRSAADQDEDVVTEEKKGGDDVVADTSSTSALKEEGPPKDGQKEEGKDEDAPEHILPENLFQTRDEAFLKGVDEYLTERGLKVFAADDEVKGKRRVVMDNVLSPEESAHLIQLAAVGAKQGDGYAGFENRPSPHTNHELFEGLTIQRTIELLGEGRVTEKQARLFIQSAEKARDALLHYYGLKDLFFHYTHLVCRTALSDSNQAARADLSHPVHADNCYIQADGSCLKEPPAYVWRDISAILYLNDDFEGGDFFFAHKNLSVQHKVRPGQGRMVAFEASNYHGVEAVTKGKRCAIAMWYTLDPNYKEAPPSLPALSPKPREVSPSLQQLLSDGGYKLSMTEAELNGSDAMVVDGLATADECNLLIQLTNQGGIVGDGYTEKKPEDESTMHFTPPNANNEQCAGLTILRAAQLAESKEVSSEAVQTFLDLSEKAKEIVQKYFVGERTLYFDYTHLTCRTALDGNKLERDDLSHPVHADNCFIQSDGSCLKKAPAYTQRDYSALLYLNNDFLGGEFFFAHHNKTVKSSVRPTCGRIVAYDAGTYHGVQPLLQGRGCTLAMWYTLDAQHSESDHAIAQNLLNKMEQEEETEGYDEL